MREIFHTDTHGSKTWECPRCHAYQRYRLFSGDEFRISGIEVTPLVATAPEAPAVVA